MNPLYEASLFTRRVIGDHAVYDDSRLFRAGVFPNRIVQGKPLVVTPDHLARVVKNFSGPIGANIQHTNFLKGKAAHVLNVWQEGDELKGTVAVPLWLDEQLGDHERRVSIELDPHTFDSLVGLALCTNPAITDAQLMTAEALYFAKKTPHTTYHGQASMQHLHDMAARSGAICQDSDDKGKMTSKPEAKGFQAIHDTALAHGATCANMGYYSEEPTNLSDSLTSTMPLEASTSHAQPSDNLQAPSVPPTPETKEKKRMKLSDIIAYFTGHSTIENDLEEVVPTTPVAVTPEPAPVVDVTKTSEFTALEAQKAELEAQLAEFTNKVKAEFTTQNETAVDALIEAGKYDPAQRDQLLLDRAESPVLFDKMAALIPVPAEFVAATTPTVPAEQVAATLDAKRTDTSLASTAQNLVVNGMSPRL